MKTITFANLTDIGRVRTENQDSLGKFPSDNLDSSSPKGQLFIVADGMGGHAGGREASRLAVETVSKTYFDSSGTIVESLKQAFDAGNKAIYEESLNNPQLRGMGTTCIALVLQKGAAYVAHVGDSRLYKITSKAIEQLTNDHTKVGEMVRRGIITAGEAEVHPERSMLYRAMGVSAKMEFDVMNGMQLGSDEYYLMCTDGLTGYVDSAELKEVVITRPPEEACSLLVEYANRRGGLDNITVQIIHVKGDSFLKSMLQTG